MYNINLFDLYESCLSIFHLWKTLTKCPVKSSRHSNKKTFINLPNNTEYLKRVCLKIIQSMGGINSQDISHKFPFLSAECRKEQIHFKGIFLVRCMKKLHTGYS
jgi:hypothetical protein